MLKSRVLGAPFEGLRGSEMGARIFTDAEIKNASLEIPLRDRCALGVAVTVTSPDSRGMRYADIRSVAFRCPAGSYQVCATLICDLLVSSIFKKLKSNHAVGWFAGWRPG